MRIALLLPYPPSVNTYWRNVKGRTLISKKGREYRKSLIAAVSAQQLSRMQSGEPPCHITGRIYASVVAHPPDRRRRDLDNILKALLDGLQHAGVYEDDSQIDKLSIIRADRVDGGMVSVQIIEIDE